MKAIAILCLLSVSFGASSLESIQRNEFGRHLFDTIQLQLSLKGGVDDVIRLIERLRDSIVDEQGSADTAHGDFQESCTTTINEHNDEIANQEAKVIDADILINDLGPKLTEAEDNKVTAEADLETKTGERDAADARRQEESELHAEAIGEYDAAIAACEEAITLVTENLLATGFLQTDARSPVMIQMTKHAAAIRKVAPSYAGLIKALVQLSSDDNIHSDQSMISRLIDLIERLKQSLINAKAKDIENEATLQADYETEMEALDAVIEGLEDTIDTLTTNINTWGPQVADAEVAKAAAEAIINTTTTLLNDKITECNAEQESYDTETARRNDERDICQEAIDLLVTEFTGKSEKVMEAVGGSELPTTNYQEDNSE